MEAIDFDVLYGEMEELPIGACDGCGVAIDFDGDAVAVGSALYCRACADSGVHPA